MKRPLEGTGEGNAKKSKTFHPLQEKPSTSRIDFNERHLLFKAKEVHEGKGVMVVVNAEEVYGEEV